MDSDEAQAQRVPLAPVFEGVLTYLDRPCPLEEGDPRGFGWVLSQQILLLYLAEALIKSYLDSGKMKFNSNHNLLNLYERIPELVRSKIERKYASLVRARLEWTWEEARTVKQLLQYLGVNAITDTRYFWEPSPHRPRYVEGASIMMLPECLRNLVGALFVVLHNYPEGTVVERYDTTFVSLKDSVKADVRGLEDRKDRN